MLRIPDSDAKNYLWNSNFLAVQLKIHLDFLACSQDLKISCPFSNLVMDGQVNTQMYTLYVI